ncbi:MAG: MurR/RpiR family transcriptional regulator [Lachnospiraceae bacterium]
MFSEQELMGFNELEFEVYNYIMKHSEKVPYMTIRELSNEAHVSTTTILRFCKKLNCDGFSEFKIRFKIELEQRRGRHLKRDLSAIREFLNRAESSDFEDNLDQASRIMSEAKNIIFIGTGNSGVMAHYASRYFSSVGILAFHVENPMFQINPENPSDSVAVVFSVAGEGDILVNHITALRARKTKVISVTNSKNSTIARISDLNISYYVQHELKTGLEFPPKVDITTQVPAVYIIETLAKKIYNLKID